MVVKPSLPGRTGKLKVGSVIVPTISSLYVAFALSEFMVIPMLFRGLKSSNWAVRERMWIVADRRKGDECFEFWGCFG